MASRRVVRASMVPAVVALAFAGLASCQAHLAVSGAAAGPGAEVDALFGELGRAGSAGVAVMVVRDDRVLHKAGYGFADVERRQPVTPRTAFRLASVSKQFAAMAIMILAQSDRLDYDDPVVEYLPELAGFGGRLTVRHLLHHTGGLPDYYEALEAADGPMPTNQDALEHLAGLAAQFAPGEQYEYSNPGYEMLALIVERASGQKFGRFLEERIFNPLGMRDSVVMDETEPEIAERAYGYARDGEGLRLHDDHRLNHIVGSGGVYSTVEDLYLWDQALYTERLVPRTVLEEAFRPARLNSGEEHPYGFGWRLASYGPLGRRLYHAGGWVGFSTFIVRYPERRFTVILLSNLDDFEAARYADRITDLYYPSWLISDAALLDGTGEPARRASVRIERDRIVAVGDLRPAAGDLVVDAAGRTLAPGFIDAHSHAASEVFDHGDALAAVSQGITTAVVGQDGDSQLPLEEFFSRLEEEPAAVNLASFAGHGSLREQVMGEDFKRPATEEEVGRMAELLAREMAAGALGLSTGLEYDPGIYSTTEEVVALARVAAAHGGRYISHVRSEDRRFWQAIEEILTIGREAGLPVQISHIKLALRSLHGQGDRLLARLDEARAAGVEVTADLYPYTYWQSTLTVMFPDRDYEDRQAARFAVEELSLPEEMLIPVFEPAPELAGKTLAEIAGLRGTDPATTLIELIRQAEAMRARQGSEEGEEETVESVIATSMTEPDIERLMAWPHTVFCTDGGLAGAHPRGFGSFPRILGRYVRQRGVLSLAEAVRRMTGVSAAQVGIAERGLVRPGLYADLVLFDPEAVIDRATTDEPHARSEGIAAVWVNGQLVFETGRSTARRPGRAVRRRPAAEEVR